MHQLGNKVVRYITANKALFGTSGQTTVAGSAFFERVLASEGPEDRDGLLILDRQ